MRFVVRGATGLLGANLAVLLREAGHDVRCTRRGRSRTAHLQFSSAKAERELGHAIAPIENAIADALAWFRAHGMLKG